MFSKKKSYQYTYASSGYRPDKVTRRIQNEKTIVNTIYNKISVDAASINILHVRLDEDGNYKNTIHGSLNKVLNRSANIDQTGRAFILDAVFSMLDEGCVALLPIETLGDPYASESYKVLSARVGKILEWYPKEVRVEVYDESSGRKVQIVVDKKFTPIIENPFFAIMNEPNSTLQRLIRTLNQLDDMNSKLNSKRVDLIIQVPYLIKSEALKAQAEERLQSIEAQLTNSKYGIAYIDGTEKVVQLNRPLENNLWAQVKEQKEDLFNQMGLTMDILKGTADEKSMINYYSRTIEPILTAIVEEIERKWLSETAISQLQGIRFFRDPFKLVPVESIAEIADKFTRNEIMTSNEIRAKVGMPPSSDPKANELRNSNLNQKNEPTQMLEDPSLIQ